MNILLISEDLKTETSLLLSNEEARVRRLPNSLMNHQNGCTTIEDVDFKYDSFMFDMRMLNNKTPIKEQLSFLKEVKKGPILGIIDKSVPRSLIAYVVNNYFCKLINIEDLSRCAHGLEDIIKREKLEKKEGLIVSAFSHDVRNLLSVISISVDRASRKIAGVDEDVENDLNRIRRSYLKIQGYCESILEDYRKASKTNIQKDNIELSYILNECYSEHKEKILASNIDFTLESNFDGKIKGDYNKFSRVLNNLISNSIEELTSKNVAQPMIKIECTFTDKNEKLKLRFIDNGNGVEKHDQALIFDKNFSRKATGNGLGLYICKEMIESLNGVICLESSGSVGTAFCITLPFEKAS